MKTYSLILIIIYSMLLAAAAGQAPAKTAATANLNQVKFRRLPPPKFSAALGSSIIIECEAGGSPPPTIHWLKDGKRLLQSSDPLAEEQQNQVESENAIGLASGPVNDLERMSLSATRARLFIDCADYEHEATYTCVAENAFTRVSAHTRLSLVRAAAGAVQPSAEPGVAPQIAALPQCLGQPREQLQASAPARIHMWTHNIVEVMKNNLLLYCRANARKALVSWTLPDDKTVGQEQKDKYEVLDSGDLLIKDLRWSDMGSYICTVSDEQSSDSVSSFVYPAARKIARTSNE